MGFSATDAAFEGFRLARRSPMAIVLWAALYIVLSVLILLLIGGPMALFAAEAARLEGLGGEPELEEMMPLASAYLSMIGLMFPLSLLFGAIMYAAVNRAVLRPEEKRFGYLRLGGDELRVLVVYFVLSIIFMLLALVLFGIVGVVTGVVAGTVGEGGAAVLTGLVLGLAAFVAFLWIVVRLCLALPMTVAEKRLAIFDSWGVTRGHVWGLIGMTILAFVLSMVVSILGWIIFMPLMFLMGGGLQDLAGANLEGAPPMELLSTLGPIAIVAGVWLALVSALQLAIMYAPYAAAYRDLRGGGAAAATTAAPVADPAI